MWAVLYSQKTSSSLPEWCLRLLFAILKSYHGKLVYKSSNLIDIILSRYESDYYVLYLEINKNKKCLIKVQIYNQLRGKILNGELKSDIRLPSSRELASELNISRNTVLSAYEVLISEGYVDSIGGSGVS